MIQREAAINSDDQPSLYGPVVWDVLSDVASTINGATYLIGQFTSPTLHFFHGAIYTSA